MKRLENNGHLKKEIFYKICVIGGGLTGALMILLLLKSKLFNKNEIAWIKPENNSNNDTRTTFYNSTSINILEELGLLNSLKAVDYTNVKEIKVFGAKGSIPITWNNHKSNGSLGRIIKNNVIFNTIMKELNDVKHYNAYVTNTTNNEFERTLYLNNRKSIKTHLVLSADGKNSYLRKLLSINTINKSTEHIAVSGFLQLSKKHNGIAIQAFTDLGPIGILPFENNNIINFVQSIENKKFHKISTTNNFTYYLCKNLNDFFVKEDFFFKPLKNLENVHDEFSSWNLDLNFIANPTTSRAILLGDAAHSIHPLAGQGFNLAIKDCVSVIKAISKSIQFGNDLGDRDVTDLYKSDRFAQTLAMTTLTDFLFYGFTETSPKTKLFLNKGMENLNKSNLKDVFKIFASI